MVSANKIEAIEIENSERQDMEEEMGNRGEPEEFTRMVPWKKQLTVRGLIVSIVIGIVYSIIVMKLNLTTGLVPNLDVSSALIAYILVQIWIKLLEKAGIVSTPFTRQENTVILTCATACYSISLGGLRKSLKQKYFLYASIIFLLFHTILLFVYAYET